MAIPNEMEKTIDKMNQIREDGSIGATPRACSGSRAQFTISFPAVEDAFTCVKFVNRSDTFTLITMGRTPQEEFDDEARIRIRVDEDPPVDGLADLLDTTYNTEPGV